MFQHKLDECVHMASNARLKLRKKKLNHKLMQPVYPILHEQTTHALAENKAFEDYDRITVPAKPRYYSSSYAEGDLYRHYKIPCVCHQTWKTKTDLPDDLQRTMEINRRLNPDMTFKLYDDDDIDAYIRNNFPKRVYDTFSAINPRYGASRADLFRYCVLYKEGGIYLDIKAQFTKNIFADVVRSTDVAVLDNPRYMEKFRELNAMGTWEQWVLIFAPGHDYMRRAIERICDEVQYHCQTPQSITFTTAVFPGEHRPHTTNAKETVLRLTGPDGLANSIHASMLAQGQQHRSVNINSFCSLGSSNKRSMYKRGEHYSEQQLPLIVCPAAVTLR